MPSPIVDSTSCLMLAFSRPGVTRRLKKDQFTAADADKALVGASKKIIDSPEYAAVAAYERGVKAYVAHMALPSTLYRDGAYLILNTRVKAVDEFLEKSKPEWEALRDAYVEVYPQRKTETLKRLGLVGDDGDYADPADVKAAFGFEWSYVVMSTPSTLKQISADLWTKEEERLRARLQTAEQDIVAAFREQFSVMVTGMKEMLTGEKADGKKQKFYGLKVENLLKFMESFGDNNICGDDPLAALIGDARKLLQGVDPDTLRKDETWKANLGASFATIEANLATLTVAKGKRYIEIDEEAAS